MRRHGNEATARHHTHNKLNNEGETRNLEVIVPENSSSFCAFIVTSSPDRIAVSLKSPSGEEVEKIPERPETSFEVYLEKCNCTVKVEYSHLLSGIGSNITRVILVNPIPGIWTITVHGELIVNGTYNAWLPITGLVTPGVEFVNSTPRFTIVTPGISAGNITCSAYNNVTGTLYDSSSWGPTRILANKPDLAAPGVNVTGVFPNEKLGNMTGTSVAAGITTGACALMLQWGIVNGNSIELNTDRIKAFLIRGCSRELHISYPSDQWGYGKLNLLNTFNLLRP
ncbi:MAG: S8 family serine peptidase [Oscillospiraceae bacterium]|nr:S8 family serine peptidase [Oscillospiraceae bacterium]